MIIKVQGCTIRPVEQNEAELEQVLAVYRQCEDFLALGPIATASLEMIAADLALSRHKGGTFCAIEGLESGEMVGVVDFVCGGFEGDPELAFLSLLMIAAPHRNRGLGAAVVRGVEDAIRDDSRARAIRSGVQANNPGGIRFWQRMGYHIISGAEPLADGTVAFNLWKKIT
jgi:ribosomal protein S18 acetylase RimI-like enzyme